MRDRDGAPEDLWIVEWPPGVEDSREKVRRAREAEKLLGGLVDVAQGGYSEALFVVLMDAQVRCREYVKRIHAADNEARTEALREELREVEAAIERGGP